MQRKLLLLSLLFLTSFNLFAQDLFCGLLQQIVKDSRTRFSAVKGKLLNESGDVKNYESPYKLDGQSFGIIKQTKDDGTFFFAFISKFPTEEAAINALSEFAKNYQCTTGIVAAKRSSAQGKKQVEFFIRETGGFYLANAILDVAILEKEYYLSFHVHTPDQRFFQPVTTAKVESEFSKAIFNVLLKKKQGADAVKTIERKTPETAADVHFYETQLKIPGADTYVIIDNSWIGEKYIVASFATGKPYDKAQLETLYKQTLSSIDKALGSDGYFYVTESGGYTSYYHYNEITFRATYKLFTVYRDDKSNRVTISFSTY